MIDALSVYGPNIVASLMTSVALAIAGALLASRSQSLQAFVTSQSTLLGVTVGLATLHFVTGSVEGYAIVPIAAAFAMAMAFYLLGRKLCSLYQVKSNEILIALFLLSLSLSYLLTAALPFLESHFSTAFLGDIATASKTSSNWLSAISLLATSFFVLKFKRLALQSFWLSSGGVLFEARLNQVFFLVCALLIVESTRIFGFLFTSASLIVAPLAVSLCAKGLKEFILQSTALAGLSTFVGFMLSLYWQGLSTSAAIVVSQIAMSITFVLLRLVRSGRLASS
jgi:ABC-type Mn2+/Zn2+ transport system permease subunit